MIKCMFECVNFMEEYIRMERQSYEFKLERIWDKGQTRAYLVNWLCQRAFFPVSNFETRAPYSIFDIKFKWA